MAFLSKTENWEAIKEIDKLDYIKKKKNLKKSCMKTKNKKIGKNFYFWYHKGTDFPNKELQIHKKKSNNPIEKWTNILQEGT